METNPTRKEKPIFPNKVSGEEVLHSYRVHIFQYPVHQFDFTMGLPLHVWFYYNLLKSFPYWKSPVLSQSHHRLHTRIFLREISPSHQTLVKGVIFFLRISVRECVEMYLKHSQLWQVWVVKRKQTSKLCKPKCEHGFSEAGVCNPNW